MSTTEVEELPTILSVRRERGVAGMFAVHVRVEYPGEAPAWTRFEGSGLGGPVLAVSPGGHQTWVTDPGRFGDFTWRTGEEWARRFYA